MEYRVSVRVEKIGNGYRGVRARVSDKEEAATTEVYVSIRCDNADMAISKAVGLLMTEQSDRADRASLAEAAHGLPRSTAGPFGPVEDVDDEEEES
jgi:hypothetical protein